MKNTLSAFGLTMGLVSMGLLVVAIVTNSSVAFLIGMCICCVGALCVLRAEKLVILALLAFSLNSNAQVWSPKQTTNSTKTEKVQCWGTTTKKARCKRMIDPAHPASAIKDVSGVYYCAQHTKQAK